VKDEPNRVWYSDATHIPLVEGDAYLVANKDACSRRITGWRVGLRQNASLYIEALEAAILHCRPDVGIIIHSGHRSQYTYRACRDVVAKHGLLQSMDEVGSCFDNAVSVSWVSHFKRQALCNCIRKDLEELTAR